MAQTKLFLNPFKLNVRKNCFHLIQAQIVFKLSFNANFVLFCFLLFFSFPQRNGVSIAIIPLFLMRELKEYQDRVRDV